MTSIIIEDRYSRVAIRPDLGAGLASFEALMPDGEKPVLRPLAPGHSHPFDLACNLLAPFSNRIAGGGFAFEGRFHSVPPNLPDIDPNPLHGDAPLKPWRLVEQAGDRARLALDDGAIGPWRYAARVEWRLDGGTLHGVLRITNRGPRLPFGGGFHPWLPRYADTCLQFAATSIWLADEGVLPTRQIALFKKPDWDFGVGKSLPRSPIDNAFAGWDGAARIGQPSLGLDIDINAEPPLDHALVFSPGSDAGFFCFEPVSHAIDAINRPGHPDMTMLEPGDEMVMAMRIGWTAR